MGVKAGVFNEKTGPLAALRQSIEEDDIMLIANNGVIIRTPVEQISSLSRVSQGVRVMRLKDDNIIVGVALVKKEEESDENTEDDKPIISNDNLTTNDLTQTEESAILNNQNNTLEIDVNNNDEE